MAGLFYILLVLPGLFALSNAASVAIEDVTDNSLPKIKASDTLPENIFAANGSTPIALRETPESFARRFMVIPSGVDTTINPDLYYQNNTAVQPEFQTGQPRINWAGCDCQRTGSYWTSAGACFIASPAPKGKYCYCTYVQFGTCHGYAYDCPADKMHWSNCQGNCTTDDCCKNLPENFWKHPDCKHNSNTILEALLQTHQDGLIYGAGQQIPMG